MSTAWWCRNGYLKQWKGCLRWEEAVKAVYISEVIKLNFCPDFEQKVWSRFWSWSSGEILKLKFGQYFAKLFCWILVKILKLGLVMISSGDTDVWLRFWSKCFVIESPKLKFEDLCKNLWYVLKPRVRCAFGNFYGLKWLAHVSHTYCYIFNFNSHLLRAF